MDIPEDDSMRTPEQVSDELVKEPQKDEDIRFNLEGKKEPIIPNRTSEVKELLINSPITKENLNNPENPNGYVRIRVSQPELLYLLAQEKTVMEQVNATSLSATIITDNLFTAERTAIFHPSENSYIGEAYKYQTELFLAERQKAKPDNGFYTPGRTTQVISNLREMGVNVDIDNDTLGRQRLKFYEEGGECGVEVCLGWVSESEWRAFYIDLNKRLEGGSIEERNRLLQSHLERSEKYRSITATLVNKQRLDNSQLEDNVRLNIPATEEEFREQLEFYRSTLEKVLIALYEEAGITPKVDITLRPPIRSEDKIEELRSISSEVVTTVSEEQLFPEKVTLNDIKGQPNAVKEARRLVRAINEPEIYERRGIKPPKGILLVGPPGTGKTMLAKGIASEANAEFLSINAAEVGSKFINESAQLMSKVFDDAEELIRQGKKVILFLDEVDSLASLREGAHREDIKTISILLQRLDGVATIPGITLLATTNRLSSLDPAIIRSGRIDKIVNVELPNEEGRADTLKSYIGKARKKAQEGENLFSDNIDIVVVARATEGMSQAELENLINRALEVKLDDELEGDGWTPVTDTDLINMIPLVKNEFGQKSQIRKPAMGYLSHLR